MERRKASDFPPEVLKLFDGYVHGWMSRRDFLDKAGKYAVGGFSAAAMLESLRPNYAFAQQVAKNDPRIATEYLTYPSPQGSGTMKGYFARPAGAGKWPGVVVIHENRGLNPYIEDVARRLAVDGFVAFAPDALTPLGGYPGDEEKAAQMFGTLDRRQARRRPRRRRAASSSRVPNARARSARSASASAARIVNMMAVRFPDLGAAVPFYGGQPSAADAAKIKAPLHAPLRGTRRAHQRRLARLRGRAQGEQRQVPGVHLPEHEPRLPQRHDAALRRGRGQARVVAHDRLLQGKPEEREPHARAGDAAHVRHRQTPRGNLPDRADAVHRVRRARHRGPAPRPRLHDRPGRGRDLHPRELFGAVPADRRGARDAARRLHDARGRARSGHRDVQPLQHADRVRPRARRGGGGCRHADADAPLPWRHAARRREGDARAFRAGGRRLRPADHVPGRAVERRQRVGAVSRAARARSAGGALFQDRGARARRASCGA